ncbi:MAG: 3'-5' exonuclease [Campylobacterales bacterium]|nr:3'-5' exonuclease [Campylobacterales bacterium]NQY53489.1 3'-5' exonuclease [Campylobacteraceae bacterium]
MAKYILFDTETTGNQDDDKIIQFGAMIINQDSSLEVFDELCSTDVEIKLEAMEVHNLTPDMLEGKPKAVDTSFYKTLQEINTNENYLIAHNIKFDLGMIQKEGFVNNLQLIDTLRCAKHLYPDMPYHRLQYIRYALDLYKTEKEEAAKLNITIKAHDALGDVLVMKLFLSKLINKCREMYPDYNPIERLVYLTQTPVLIKTFKFGKHKGKEIAQVAQEDASYLNWMKKNMDLDEDLKYTLDKVLKTDNY